LIWALRDKRIIARANLFDAMFIKEDDDLHRQARTGFKLVLDRA
jgi:hypothetical protein